MKISAYCAVVLMVLTAGALAQGPSTVTAPAPPLPPGAGKMVVSFRAAMGKWWENSEVTKKLQLSDDQINQLNQVFYQHRLKLIDNTAAMEKEDLKLQNLLDADVPNEGQIEAQVDQTLAARGKVEREFTIMNLDLRKVLTVDQWRELKKSMPGMGPMKDKVFFRKFGPGDKGPQGAVEGMGVGGETGFVVSGGQPFDLPLPPPDPTSY